MKNKRNFPKNILEQFDTEICELEHEVYNLEKMKDGYFPIYDETHLPFNLAQGQAFHTVQGRFCVVYGDSMYCMPAAEGPVFVWPVQGFELLLQSGYYLGGVYPNSTSAYGTTLLPSNPTSSGVHWINRKWQRDYEKMYALMLGYPDNVLYLTTNDVPNYFTYDIINTIDGIDTWYDVFHPITQLEDGSYRMTNVTSSGYSTTFSIIDPVTGDSTEIDSAEGNSSGTVDPYNGGIHILVPDRWSIEGDIVYALPHAGPAPLTWSSFNDVKFANGGSLRYPTILTSDAMVNEYDAYANNWGPGHILNITADFNWIAHFNKITGDFLYTEQTIILDPNTDNWDHIDGQWSYRLGIGSIYHYTVEDRLMSTHHGLLEVVNLSQRFRLACQYSPDGTQLAYIYLKYTPGYNTPSHPGFDPTAEYEIYVSDADGSNKRMVAHQLGFYWPGNLFYYPYLAWNRDGTIIGFSIAIPSWSRQYYFHSVNVETGFRYTPITFPWVSGPPETVNMYVGQWQWLP